MIDWTTKPEAMLKKEIAPIVLHFLRDGPKNVMCHLPSDPIALRKIHIEAVYYGLDRLAVVIASQMCVVFLGHDSYTEE